MKKYLLIFLLLCLSSMSVCKDPTLKIEEGYLDTKKETRELYQPMEEKVFESKKTKKEKKDEVQQETEKNIKVKEAFTLGKARVDFMKERELHLLNLETKAGLERKKEIEELDRKYSEVLEKYMSSETEKELLIIENEIYKEYLNRLRILEETFYNQQTEKIKEIESKKI